MKKLLIAGIDPGTTVGYALLDLEGNLVELNSKKNLSFSSLISIVIESGIPVIVSCDKKPMPDFVKKLAVKTGARLIEPEKSLLVHEKRELTNSFGERIRNSHEMDSLASALFAFRQINPLLKKINIILKKEDKLDLLDKVREKAIKYSLPIREIIGVLQMPKEEEKIINKAIEKRELSEKDFLILYNKLKRAKKDIQILKQQNENLIKELVKKPKIKPQREKSDERLLFKEITIQRLNKQLKERQDIVDKLNKKIFELNNALADLSRSCLLKKLDNLSYQHYSIRNRLLKIQQKDMLFVEDLTICSKKTVDELKEKVQVIIYKKATSRILQELPFTFVSSEKFSIKHLENFALVPKAQLDKELAEKDILTNILAEYKKQRT